MADEGIFCSHGDYPCRFTQWSARSQRAIPHRVFGPVSLLQKAQAVLKLLPGCLAAAYTVLGVHPFPRLDVLIVPAGFSSLGMASPHIIFLSQSVLNAGSSGSGENDLSLCGSRICHEIAHSWFGLVIGAKDWTEEWISEGFATYLEDIIWAEARKLSSEEAREDSDLKALLRWRRLSDELKNSEEELQILRPNMESTGQVTESGSSMVKHALNPDKAFMQVHYLKGYFLLRFLASRVGEQQFITFLRLFVKKYHGQLILSQDFLRTLLITFPEMERKGLTLSAIYADWLDRPGIPKWLYERSAVWSQARLVEEVKAEAVKWILLSRSHRGKSKKRKRIDVKVNYKQVTSEQLVMLLELLLEEEELSEEAMDALQRAYNLQRQDAEVRHRWCELVVKHTHTKAYGDVEHFLVHDQAMGVYLYGELMVQEEPQQQALASRCLSLVREEMDQSARRVVEEMVL
ncbi:aminopeptidase O isoform X3 [Takifugu rubripes]|nr:aminopeptidase O isoform X3 [Takifugu rubripes]